MSLFCDISDLVSESDVEQKFIYQFLVENYPKGCSYEPSNILTKHRIKPHIIGKSKPKQYFPDYMITINGLPVMVIEAKKPDVDVYEAFSEARLYANEINAKFHHGINPCKKIIVSNGLITLAGFVDQDSPLITVNFDNAKVGDIDFSKLIDFACKDTLDRFCKDLLKQLRGESKYFKPVGQIGGKKAQNSELRENSFGRTISLDYNYILIPESEAEYKAIVENAYVESKKREQHVEPILKTIRAIKLPSIDDAKLISTQDSTPFFKGVGDFVKSKDRRHSLILLVGSVGSGKTLFVRYLKNITLIKQADLKNSITWVIVNMNSAPIARDTIYGWLTDAVIEVIKQQFPVCDFGNQKFLSDLYNEKIKEFENGVGSFLKSCQSDYNRELYQVIKDAMKDKDLTLKCLLRYISVKYKKDCIIVLDNVDKGSTQDQLLMFQVAEWFRTQYSCLVVLPLRDSTYNTHKSTPPLDTVIKDLVFRIDPPDLLTVLQLRLKYIYRLEKKEYDVNNYTLENGMKVVLQENEHLEYFKFVLNSIRHDSLVRSIFYSITGRDTRSGIELFIDFCKSGHLSAREFFAIKATEGEYVIPNFIMMNAILRGNRFYYSDIESKIKNLFASQYNDDWVDPFVRLDILKWLDNMKSIPGSSGVKGFHKADALINDLSILGHNEKVIFRELTFLIRSKLIISESSSDEFDKDDLIRISQYGVLHIYLLSNITYLSACSEDVLYRNLEIAKKISDRISGRIGDGYLSRTTVIYNVEDMLNYLREYRLNYLSSPSEIVNSCNVDIYDLEECFNSLDKIKSHSKDVLNIDERKKKYPSGLEIDCIVTSVKEFGIFVSIDFTEEGFIPNRRLKYFNPEDFEITDIISAKVIEYRIDHARFELELIERRT